MFTFNISIVSDKHTIEAIFKVLENYEVQMSQLLEKLSVIEAKLEAEAAQGQAVLIQLSDLKMLSEQLEAEVARLNELLATMPNSEELPLVIAALERIDAKVAGIIPD